MKRILFLVCIFSLYLSASEVSFAQSDFIVRTINFIIFFFILWYFGAPKITQIFTQRREKISLEFQKGQDEEKKIRKEKEVYKKNLEDAKNRANEIIALAKKDSYLISQRFEEKLDQDLKMIINNNEQKLLQEESLLVEAEVAKSLDNVCKDLNHDDQYYARVVIGGMKS